MYSLLFATLCITNYIDNISQTPSTSRYYSVRDSPSGPRKADEQYSYSYTSSTETSRNNSSNPYSSRPERTSYSTTTERKRETGPSGYSYNTDRTTTAGDGPGGYSYSSTTSGRLPHGTSYRHYSYRV